MFAAFAGVVVLAVISAPHCGAMCGPLASCVASRHGSASSSPLRRLVRYHLGRALGYGLLGGFVGGLGALALGSATPWLAMVVSWSAAIFLGASAVRRWRRGAAERPLQISTRRGPVERERGKLRKRKMVGGLAQLFRNNLRKRPGVCGSVTAFLPCGVLWAALVIASSSGSAAVGATSMVLFAGLTGASVSVVSAVLDVCDRRFGARPLAVVFGISALMFLVAPLPGVAQSLSSNNNASEVVSCPLHPGEP